MAEPAPAAKPPVTRLQAQVKLGLFAPHDIVTATLLTGLLLGTLGWFIFGSPTQLQIVIMLLISLILVALWGVLLVFRVLVFILDMQADVNLMPETAARMAVAYLQNPSSSAKR